MQRGRAHKTHMSETLKKYLPPESNIIRFGDLFERISSEEAYNLFRYLFRWDIKNVELLAKAVPTTSFTARIKEAALNGEKFYETLGIILKENV